MSDEQYLFITYILKSLKFGERLRLEDLGLQDKPQNS